MADRPWSDADRELVARTWMPIPGWGPTPREYERAAAVLDALNAAGWRREADTAEQIAQAIEAAADAYNARIAYIAGVPDRGRDGMQSSGIRRAAAIARAHRTTPTEEPTDGV